MYIDFLFRQISGLSWKRGAGLERLNGTSQDQCRIQHMLCLFLYTTATQLIKHTISSPTLSLPVCSFLCLVQPQTSLNNWPWLYFTAEHILRFCTLVRSVKDQSHVKVPFDHVIELFKLYPLTAFSCTSSRSNLPYIYGTMWFNRLIIQ